MKKILYIVLVLLPVLLSAQGNMIRLPSGGSDRRSKMLSSAQRLEIQGQFDLAAEIYSNMLRDYPNDVMIVTRLFSVLIRTAKLDEAENLLKKHESTLPVDKKTEMRVRLFLQRGNIEDAENIALEALKKNNYKNSLSNVLGSLFAAFKDDEFAIKIYEKTREVRKSPKLYIVQLATAYQNVNKPEKAIKEILKYAENKHQRYTMLRLLRSIIDSDITLLEDINKSLRSLDKDVAADIMTELYIHVKDYESALKEVKKLTVDRIGNFIRQQMQLKNWDVAREGYVFLKDSAGSFVEKAELRLDIARVDLNRHEYQLAYDDMTKLHEELLAKKYPTRRKNLKFESSVILAELERNLNHDFPKMIDYLVSAKKSTNNVFQRNQVTMELMKHYLFNNNKDEYEKYKKMLRINNSNSSQTLQFEYLEIQRNLMEGFVEKADTILADVIINYPSEKGVNDLLMLSNAMKNVSAGSKDKFWSIFALYNNAYPDSAVKECISEFKKSKDDVFLLYGLFWAFESDQSDKISEFKEIELENEILSGFAQSIYNKFDEQITDNEDFITENPDNAFTPLLRYYVLRK